MVKKHRMKIYNTIERNKNSQEEKSFRKKRKEQRKNKALGISCQSKKSRTQNVSVPNLSKHKKNIIKDLNKKNKNSSREELITNLSKKLDQKNSSEYISLSAITEDSTMGNILYDSTKDTNLNKDSEDKRLNETNIDMSKRAYMKILDEVIENSDVVLEVLDARDPLSCRSKDLESMILSHKDDKKIILILNKIDLVPMDNALMWQRYMKREFPTVLFKANTQNQNSNLSQASLFNKAVKEGKDFIEDILNSNKAIGGENLINLLKNYCRTGEMKKSIVVGIVGFPNVGKSSIINSLKRGKVVGVSSTPGFTKGLQEVVLDKDIKLLDCPGVVFSHSDSNILQNVIRTEDIKDPIDVVSSILTKIPIENIIGIYQLDTSVIKGNIQNLEQILFLIGDKMKKIKKGGVVDFDKTARLVINDWNVGKLKYFTVPPGVDKESFMEQLEEQNKKKEKKTNDIEMKV